MMHYPTLPGSGAKGVGAGTAVGMRVAAGKGDGGGVGDAVGAALGVSVCTGADEKTISCEGAAD